jgi:hypothetical protein
MLNSQENAEFCLGALRFCTTQNFIRVIKIRTWWEGGVSLANLPARNYKCLQHFGFMYFGLRYRVVLCRIPAFAINLLVLYLRWTSTHKTTIWRHTAVKALNLTTKMRSEILKGRHRLWDRHRVDLKRHRSKGLGLIQVACDRNK